MQFQSRSISPFKVYDCCQGRVKKFCPLDSWSFLLVAEDGTVVSYWKQKLLPSIFLLEVASCLTNRCLISFSISLARSWHASITSMRDTSMREDQTRWIKAWSSRGRIVFHWTQRQLFLCRWRRPVSARVRSKVRKLIGNEISWHVTKLFFYFAGIYRTRQGHKKLSKNLLLDIWLRMQTRNNCSVFAVISPVWRLKTTKF